MCFGLSTRRFRYIYRRDASRARNRSRAELPNYVQSDKCNFSEIFAGSLYFTPRFYQENTPSHLVAFLATHKTSAFSGLPVL